MKEIGLIIKMPIVQASKEEKEYIKSKFYETLARWAFEQYCKENNMEDIFKRVELMKIRNNKHFYKY